MFFVAVGLLIFGIKILLFFALFLLLLPSVCSLIPILFGNCLTTIIAHHLGMQQILLLSVCSLSHFWELTQTAARKSNELTQQQVALNSFLGTDSNCCKEEQ